MSNVHLLVHQHTTLACNNMAQHGYSEKELIRHSLFFCFKLGDSATEAHRKLCQAYGDDSMSLRVCQQWYSRFKEGDEDIKNKHRSGRPAEVDEKDLQLLIDVDPKLTTREMADYFDVEHSTIVHHLTSLGKVSKLGRWVPHQLTEFDKDRRISACTQLLSYRRTQGWLNTLVTGDEKWVAYANITRKRQWCDKTERPEPTAKSGPHPLKVMLSVWWCSEGILYWELLPRGTTITANTYCAQLDRLDQAIKARGLESKTVRFLHDNARPHTAKMTSQKLLELGWEVMPHPAYSPDLAPSDYHLFRSMQNQLNGQHFENEEEVKSWVAKFFDQQDPQFYSEGIYDLPERWRTVITNNGEYISD